MGEIMSSNLQPTTVSQWFAALVWLTLGITGCAATTSKVRVDKADAGLSKCQSFDWLADSSAPASFTDQRVKAATLAALRDKGYTQSVDKPDCKIAYALSTSVRPKAKPGVGVGVGGGSGGMGGGIGISLPIGRKNENAATFTLDIIDTSRNAQIWSGAVDVQLNGAEPTDEETAAIVNKILAEFPDRAPSG
jgi:hypothetical protein